MFDLILVPLDGSQLAECVLPHTLAVAHAFDSEITLLRILEKNQAGVSAQFFDLLNWQISRTKASLYLEAIQARFQASGLQTGTMVLEGLVAERITEYGRNIFGAKLEILTETMKTQQYYQMLDKVDIVYCGK